MKTRKCIHCDEPFHGRADKKFCDSGCRSAYFYSRRRGDYRTFGQIHAVLKRNRSILIRLAAQMETNKWVDKEYLELLGFQFQYFTHEESQGKKKKVRYCYDIGYLAVEDSKIELVSNSRFKLLPT